jgi:subtilisin-like proprotein convertase family protein
MPSRALFLPDSLPDGIFFYCTNHLDKIVILNTCRRHIVLLEIERNWAMNRLQIILAGMALSYLMAFSAWSGPASIPTSPGEKRQAAAQRKARYPEGKIAVKFRAHSDLAHVQELNASVGAKIRKRYRFSEACILELPPGLSVDQALKIYRSDPRVEYAEPLYYRHFYGSAPLPQAHVGPNDPRFYQQWYHYNTGQQGSGTYMDPRITGLPGADINSLSAWDILTTSSGAIIAYVDSGFDYTNPELIESLWVNTNEIPDNQTDDDQNGYVDDVIGWDFVGDWLGPNGTSLTPDNDPLDQDGHGSFGIGCVAAKGNNLMGIAGVSWRGTIMALKVSDNEGTLSDEAIFEAYDYAIANGASVINASFGGPDYLDTEYDLLSAANDAGVLMVAAAGNDSQNSDRMPAYPANYDLPNIIAVAGTTRRDTLSEFSNFGRTSVDIAAPGQGILSALLNYDPNPDYSQNTVDFAQPRYDDDGNGIADYGFLAGTSFAAPLVSACAAMVKTRFPELQHLEIKNRILRSADPVPDLWPSSVFTGSRLDVGRALSSDMFIQRAEPYAITAGQQHVEFDLFGVNFLAGAEVTISGSGITLEALPQFIDETQLKMTVSVAPWAERSRRSVTVMNPDGSVGARDECLYIRPEPVDLFDVAMVPIPNFNPIGVRRSLLMPVDLYIDDIEIGLDITHEWIGDLNVVLIAPDGTRAFLVQQPGNGLDSSQDIVTTFPTFLRPAQNLDVLKGKNAKGIWTLIVSDVQPVDTGTLNSWKLRFYDNSLMEFQFTDSDTKGWTFSGPVLPFTPPTAFVQSGLALQSTSNTNTFGFWMSPSDSLSLLPDMLYRATFSIVTDEADSRRVPSVRLRAFSQKAELSYSLAIDSNGEGECSPTPDGKLYSLYFQPPSALSTRAESGDDFAFAVDLVNFNPADSPDAAVICRELTVERIPLDLLSTPSLVAEYAFDNGSDGWLPVSAEMFFTPPIFDTVQGALLLTAQTATDTFGGWTSPPITPVAPGQLYCVTFSVATDTTDTVRVPSLRLRVQHDAFQTSSQVQIISTPWAQSVATSTARPYRVYFTLPRGSATGNLLAAFDMLNFDPSDAPDGSLELHHVRIDRLELP